jgi:hypothetical protein
MHREMAMLGGTLQPPGLGRCWRSLLGSGLPLKPAWQRVMPADAPFFRYSAEHTLQVAQWW